MSATRHHLGNYPVFLTTPYRNSRLTAEFARPHIEALVEQLLLSVPKSRIYSVFGPDPIVDMFCEIIRERAGMVVDQSYYAAKFTWCTSDTLTAARPKNPLLTGTVLRQATMRDLRRAGVLCKDFADDSVSSHLSTVPEKPITHL